MWRVEMNSTIAEIPNLSGDVVAPPGIEPGTRGFSVHCSTD